MSCKGLSGENNLVDAIEVVYCEEKRIETPRVGHLHSH